MILADLAATEALGRQVAALLQPGDLVVLDGPLGAGKTTFVQGLARGLGITDPVTSPTFTLVHVLRGGRLPLTHVDAWRMLEAGPDGMDDLELDVVLETGVVVVEWGGGMVEHLTDDRLHLTFARHAADDVREVVVTGHGRWAGRSFAPQV